MNAKLLTASIFVSLSFAAATSANDAREQAARIIAQIQRADYEGDRAAMQRGYDELKPFAENQELASRIRYWRGFAQWRRAINGFNDAVDPKELEQNLNTALDEFKIAMKKDPALRYGSACDFVDAMRVDSPARSRALPGVSRSIAVLPFVNASPDPDNEYLSDGITDELIDALAKVEGIRVASRPSVFALKGKPQDVRAIGALLD